MRQSYAFVSVNGNRNFFSFKLPSCIDLNTFLQSIVQSDHYILQLLLTQSIFFQHNIIPKIQNAACLLSIDGEAQPLPALDHQIYSKSTFSRRRFNSHLHFYCRYIQTLNKKAIKEKKKSFKAIKTLTKQYALRTKISKRCSLVYLSGSLQESCLEVKKLISFL